MSQKYVIAVSGGVDSVALLDMLMNNNCTELKVKKNQLIVAHFDHGIREESVEDVKFVEGLAKKYGLKSEVERGRLGQNCSEEKARQARYKFLRQICKKYDAQLITAHHQDDVIETMIINLIRGTSWRGLISLRLISEFNEITINRPLLDIKKQQILEYAKENDLKWREDNTNNNEKYLRNYVRLQLLPKMSQNDTSVKKQFLEINRKVNLLSQEIATALQKHIKLNSKQKADGIILQRYWLVMLPSSVTTEVLRQVLLSLDSNWHPTANKLTSVIHFIKTARLNKTYQLSKTISIASKKQIVEFHNR